MALTYRIIVNGVDKGEVYRNVRNNRLEWYKPSRGKEQYPKRFTLTDVCHHVARLCLTDPRNVTLKRK